MIEFDEPVSKETAAFIKAMFALLPPGETNEK